MGGGQAKPNPFGPQGWTPDRIGPLDGKVFVITGTTTGCGFQASKILLSKGASVVMLNRSAAKSEEVASKLKKELGNENAKVSHAVMDLNSLASVRACAEEVLKTVPQIDALICNAAIAQVATQKLTLDGFESQLGVNHYGHFLLCGMLFGRVEASNGRIVVVGSNGYKMGPKTVNFEDMNYNKGYQDFPVYCHSKMVQMMFAYELQRRCQSSNKKVQVHICHPGASRTELAKDDVTCMMKCMLTLFAPLGQSAERGAYPEVMCATEPTLKCPAYWGPTRRMETVGAVGECPLQEHVLNAEQAAKLWTLSEEKTGLKWTQF